MKKAFSFFAVLLLGSSFFAVNTKNVPISGEGETDIYSYNYMTDVSAYIDFIEPTGELWSDSYLLLVNRENPLEKNGEALSKALCERSAIGGVPKGEYDFRFRPELKMNTTALKALTAMLREAVASGGLKSENLQVLSAYRSYAAQEGVFNRNVRSTKKYRCTDSECATEFITKDDITKCRACGAWVERIEISESEARENVASYSCAPGTSEHQSGLAVDIIDATFKVELTEDFASTEAGRWLAENCTDFGFILRFKEDKESVTGIVYEPWHFRYVGRYHATSMKELGMCLEEYVEFLTREGYFDKNAPRRDPSNMKIDRKTLGAVYEDNGLK